MGKGAIGGTKAGGWSGRAHKTTKNDILLIQEDIEKIRKGIKEGGEIIGLTPWEEKILHDILEKGLVMTSDYLDDPEYSGTSGIQHPIRVLSSKFKEVRKAPPKPKDGDLVHFYIAAQRSVSTGATTNSYSFKKFIVTRKPKEEEYIFF